MGGPLRAILCLSLFAGANAARVSHSRAAEAMNATASSKDICDSIHNLQCQDADIRNFGPVDSSNECCQACQAQTGCKAWTWDWAKPGKSCHLKGSCNSQRQSIAYHSGISGSTSNPSPPISSEDICKSIHDLQCQDADITNFGPVHTSRECCQACQAQTGCNAWTWDFAKPGKLCHLKGACNSQRHSSHYHSGIAGSASNPRPTPRPTPTPPIDPVPYPNIGADALLNEYNDPHTGIAISMLGQKGWRSGRWGLMGAPTVYQEWAQSFVTIMTREQDMSVYRGRSFGLVFHITRNSDFSQYFQMIQKGDKRGHIVGGPGDGGSHTPGGGSWRLGVHASGKDYEWFKSQKNGILDKYNTVYHNHDYNEFITNGLSKSAVAGIFHNTASHSETATDEELCQFLKWNCHDGRWPLYAYDRHKRPALKIERYLDCY